MRALKASENVRVGIAMSVPRYRRRLAVDWAFAGFGVGTSFRRTGHLNHSAGKDWVAEPQLNGKQ